MMKRILLNLIAISLLAIPLMVLAAQAAEPGYQEAPMVGVQETVTRVTNIIFSIVLLGAAICVIIAASMFLTAAGDPEKINSARNYLLYALIAVIVAVAARGIVWFVTTAVWPAAVKPT